MRTIETQSTSRSSAGCNPIVLREGEQVRLVFVPFLVDNPANPKASVDGHFIYQRKAKSGRWIPVPTIPLSSLRAGDEFKLTLHAQELRMLLEGLVPLYKFYEQQGVPSGHKTFVQVDSTLARFVSLGQKDLSALLESQPEDASLMLLKLVKWLATSTGRRQAAERLFSQAPEQMPAFSALLGIAALKEALHYWRQNLTNNSESFWQQSLQSRSYVISQIFAYPVVVIGSKAYVGGKQITRRGGKEVDFLIATQSTNALILVEIKTPQTKLLGPEYRESVFPISHDLSSAIAQVLRYRQSLMRRFDSVTAELSLRLTLGDPRCVVIAGDSAELATQASKENFELQRERIQGVTIVTYDELFRRLEKLVSLLEEGDIL